MIYPLSWYYIEGKPLKEEYILGFTRMKKEDMIRGIEIIGEVLYYKIKSGGQSYVRREKSK